MLHGGDLLLGTDGFIVSVMKRTKFWRDFCTQKELRELIQKRVNEKPFETPFEDDLISDLIAERHYFCRLKGLRPDSFKKTRENTPYRFYGLFSHGWHSVSWAKCLIPLPSETDLIVRALRDRIASDKIGFRISHPRCAHCQSAPSEEVHHASPTFEEITEKVLVDLTEDTVREVLSTWDWFKTEDFTLPDDLELVRKFDAIHRDARLEALCKQCHNKTKRHETKPVCEDAKAAILKLLE